MDPSDPIDYPSQAISDLADNFSADHFRHAIGVCRSVIAQLEPGADSPQQIARRRILRYWDRQLERATLWIDGDVSQPSLIPFRHPRRYLLKFADGEVGELEVWKMSAHEPDNEIVSTKPADNLFVLSNIPIERDHAEASKGKILNKRGPELLGRSPLSACNLASKVLQLDPKTLAIGQQELDRGKLAGAFDIPPDDAPTHQPELRDDVRLSGQGIVQWPVRPIGLGSRASKPRSRWTILFCPAFV